MAPEELTITATEANDRLFAPYGKLVPMKDLRLVSSIPLRAILGGKVPIGTPTADTNALTFWSGLADVDMGPVISFGVLAVKQRHFQCDMLERHAGGPEILIPLDTCGMVMLVASATSAAPSADEVRAFLLDGSKAIILNEGTWHWVPYPLVPTATLAVIQKRGTYQEDTGFKRLVPKVRIALG